MQKRILWLALLALAVLAVPAYAWLKPGLVKVERDILVVEATAAPDSVIFAEVLEDGTLHLDVWYDHDLDLSTPRVWASIWWGDWDDIGHGYYDITVENPDDARRVREALDASSAGAWK